MAGYNKVVIMGNLVRDPELRWTPQGTAVCDITIAINERKDQPAEFVDVTLWEKVAETVQTFKRKGHEILVEGKLKAEKWDDKETGKPRSKLKVTAVSVTFTGRPSDNDDAQQNVSAPAETPAATIDDDEEVPF